MSSDFLTVEAAAAILQMHPKTVLRYIREGRLRATKLGKQYRLLRSDLNAFAGASAPGDGQARVTSIVDVQNVDSLTLQRLTAVLLGAAHGKDTATTSLSVDIAHDAARDSAKVIIVGSPDDAATLLKLVSACLEG
ncbi:helix-turn-helix domain-containing protein [Devosia sp. XK-2]|uniref:helix-turn-helix domain-containing protein n=1 Tax=Devosia sp. XK-2 TaxID=3126689 RepID=UPI0030D30EEE